MEKKLNIVKFSVIITSYNYDNFIIECLDSCLKQLNFSDYEVIVVDDGSNDNTKQILSDYKDDKLSVYFIENSGIEKASNYGILKSKGNYVVRVDADDKLDQNFLFEMSQNINDSNCDFYYSNYSVIDSNSKVIENILLPTFEKNEIVCRGDFLATGTVYKRDILNKLGLYDTTVKNSGLENFELIIKLLLNNFSGKLIPKSLFFYRRHLTNMSEVKKSRIIEYGNRLFVKFNLGKYRTNSNHPYKLEID